RVRRLTQRPVGLLVERGNAWVPCHRIERCVLHTQRIEDALPRELIERHAGRDFDDPQQYVEAELAAVGPACPWLEVEWHFLQPRHDLRYGLSSLRNHVVVAAGAHSAT